MTSRGPPPVYFGPFDVTPQVRILVEAAADANLFRNLQIYSEAREMPS